MTPKLRLIEHARKRLLSWMLKSFHLGTRRRSRSMQMILEPTTQAG
jgi:hypothetical protein